MVARSCPPVISPSDEAVVKSLHMLGYVETRPGSSGLEMSSQEEEEIFLSQRVQLK